MKYSQLFGKTSKTSPSDADSVNARLLEQGGFVDHLMAGVYTYLPLGLRVLDRIKAVIREEMNAIGAQEVLMPALLPAEPWKTSGRWEDPGPEVMFQFKGRNERDLGLGWTHEEIVTPLVKKYVRSYRDLPLAVYQIQDKFRNEPRAKSGLLRGREFSMKDLYSFHATEADLDAFYEKAREAYHRVFERCGIPAHYTEAAGGSFSKYSHEFQVPTESGEDIIHVCEECGRSINKEIADDFETLETCPTCKGKMNALKAIEVGNIFKQKLRFTEPFGVKYAKEDGSLETVTMGAYGIGPSRVMGAIAEAHHDDKGLMWPKEVAPFPAHVVAIRSKSEADQEKIEAALADLESQAAARGLELLVDDRDTGAGEKFADADLIGCPVRLVVSAKTLEKGGVEYKLRASEETEILTAAESVSRL